MKFSPFWALTMLFLAAMGFGSFAQDRCGTVAITESQITQKKRERSQRFEEWLQAERLAFQNRRTAGAATYKIPVVVHIIHKGEALGSGANLSDAQILSQIKVLNKDFNRLNKDTTSTPEDFRNIAGYMDVEFVLAKQDPEGNATNGILRVRGSRNTWTVNDETSLKATSYWPAEDYLNIWVTDLASTLLGYAQFPVSNLAGLEDAENNRLTDGVVIDYKVFGSIEDGNFNLDNTFRNGRTTTHEVGHFFGLRHIWGDDNGACGGNNDYVTDTPDQSEQTSGCPSHPQTTCSVKKMFQNYMDYTNDGCMNLFTQGQVSRMLTVLNNSPRRKSLLQSPGLQNPVLPSYDLAIDAIIKPVSNSCVSTIIPEVRIKNEGAEAVTSATIALLVDGATKETKSITTGTLITTDGLFNVQFAQLQLASGEHQLQFKVLAVNGNADEKADNNIKNVTVDIPYFTELPITQRFDNIPQTWKVVNGDGGITWQTKVAPDGQLQDNQALWMNFFDYNLSEAKDVLISPKFSIANDSNPYLLLDVAYANGSSADGLKIYIVTDCDNYSSGNLIFNKSGSALSTITSTARFTPAGAADWRREEINLSAFKGMQNIQIAIEAVNASGNDLFIDNLSIVSDVIEDVEIVRVESPVPVQCATSVTPKIVVKNNGRAALQYLKVKYTLNGTVNHFVTTSDFSIAANQQSIITLPPLTLAEGRNELAFEALAPNRLIDKSPPDNALRYYSVVNDASDIIPLRENFNATFPAWSTVVPYENNDWEKVNTFFDQSLRFISPQGDSHVEAWIASPVLDLSNVSAASVFFDYAFITNDSADSRLFFGDELSVIASTDCGQSYPITLWNSTPQLLFNLKSPAMSALRANDWNRKFIDLSPLVGSQNARIAFIFKGRSNNQLLIDNIEFFNANNPQPLAIDELFSVYGTDPTSPSDFYLTFNLPQRENVMYELIDLTGKQLVRSEITTVLNQTFHIAPDNTSAGIYVLRIMINDKFYTRKLYLNSSN
jgi:hypothetical protein